MMIRRIAYFLAIFVLGMPTSVFADETVQSKLAFEKFIEIIPPSTLAMWAGIQAVLSIVLFLAAARICFGPESLIMRSIKYWVYSILAGLGVLLLIGLSVFLMGSGGGVIVVGIAALLLSLFLAFAIPMHVFDASFLRVLVFMVVSFIFNVIGSVASSAVTSQMFDAATVKNLEKWAKDVEKGRVRADWDYSKNAPKIEKEEGQPPARDQPAPLPPQQEAAALNARFAGLKERFAKMDKTNSAEVTQYNADYKKYTEDLNAYNARVKAAQPPASAAPPNQ